MNGLDYYNISYLSSLIYLLAMSGEETKPKKIGEYLVCTFISTQKRLWGRALLARSNWPSTKKLEKRLPSRFWKKRKLSTFLTLKEYRERSTF